MHSDQQHTPLFNFIHPDHAYLSRPAQVFWNIIGLLLFILLPGGACILCLGMLLGLAALQAAWPALAHGTPLALIAVVEGGAIVFVGDFIVGMVCVRHELAQVVRDHVYEAIEDMPRFR